MGEQTLCRVSDALLEQTIAGGDLDIASVRGNADNLRGANRAATKRSRDYQVSGPGYFVRSRLL